MEDEVKKEETTPLVESKEVSGKKLIMISTKNACILSGVIIALALLFVYKSIFIAAVVNGSPISRFSVIQEVEKKSGKAALDMIIIQRILADEVHKQGITITESEVDAEMKEIEARFTAQATTLDAMLASQGMTRADVTKQIMTQLQVEKLLGEKIAVSDAEVDQYIAEKKIVVPKDKDAEMRTQVAAQIKQEKTNKEGNALVESLRGSAKVTYFVQY
jgi:foldase protein PrsA